MCAILALVTWCEVVFRGRDEKTYTQMVEGRSLYHAAAQALDQASRLWWFDPSQTVLVRVLRPVAEYRLTTIQVRLWEERQNGKRPGSKPNQIQ